MFDNDETIVRLFHLMDYIRSLMRNGDSVELELSSDNIGIIYLHFDVYKEDTENSIYSLFMFDNEYNKLEDKLRNVELIEITNMIREHYEKDHTS